MPGERALIPRTEQPERDLPKRSGTTRIDHPLVGALELSYEQLPISGTDRQTLCLYHAVLGSAGAQALALLAAAAAEEREPARGFQTR